MSAIPGGSAVARSSYPGATSPHTPRYRSTIVGNLVEDPEFRFTNTGIAVANLRVAVTQRVQQDGEWRDGETSFFKVNVWRGQAEHLADSLAKGDRVMVTGRLRQRSWETPEGEKRSVTEIEADEVGASLKFATAKVERATERAASDRTQGRERQTERGGDFNEAPPNTTGILPRCPSRHSILTVLDLGFRNVQLRHVDRVALHDGWAPYRDSAGATHALGNAHHLRELDALAAEAGQGGSGRWRSGCRWPRPTPSGPRPPAQAGWPPTT